MRKKGYFCTVKFIPHPLRDENVNIGVILFSPDDLSIQFKFDMQEVKKKIKRLDPDFDYSLCKTLITELSNHVKAYNGTTAADTSLMTDLEASFKKFIRLGPIKKYLVNDLNVDIKLLYDKFVSDVSIQNRAHGFTARELVASVRNEFVTRRLFKENLVKEDVNGIGKLDNYLLNFMYLTDSINYIHALSFDIKSKDPKEIARNWAYSFEDIKKNNTDVNIEVVLYPPQHADNEAYLTAKKIMEQTCDHVYEYHKKEIEVLSDSSLSTLIHKIENKARPISKELPGIFSRMLEQIVVK